MKVDFLYWEDCPSHEDGLDRLRAVLAEEGVDSDLRLIEIRTDEDAHTHRFTGSPTIRIEGVDVDPTSAQGEFSLTCRVYRHENGRFSPLPSIQTLREAIKAARSA
jgi:hypothetical protein